MGKHTQVLYFASDINQSISSNHAEHPEVGHNQEKGARRLQCCSFLSGEKKEEIQPTNLQTELLTYLAA